MYISKHKIKFLLTRVLSMIDEAQKYEISNLSYSSSISFKIPNSTPSGSYSTYSDDKIHIEMSKSDPLAEISEISIKRNDESIVLKISDLKDFKSETVEIKNKAFEKIKSFEDKKFLKMFPEYDTSLDRDLKLEELLGAVKEEKTEEKKEEKVIVKERKKFLGMF